MKCFIYRNLHKEGCVYSIKALEGEFKGRIIGYASGIMMQKAEFRVSAAGRERVRREKRKHVHAGIVGNVFKTAHYEERLCRIHDEIIKPYLPLIPLTHVKYNPYMHETFVAKEGTLPVTSAAFVIISGSAVGVMGVNAVFR